jgi:hypothetical protein
MDALHCETRCIYKSLFLLRVTATMQDQKVDEILAEVKGMAIDAKLVLDALETRVSGFFDAIDEHIVGVVVGTAFVLYGIITLAILTSFLLRALVLLLVEVMPPFCAPGNPISVIPSAQRERSWGQEMMQLHASRKVGKEAVFAEYAVH